MCAPRKTVSEQYQIILDCRKSGMSEAKWCRERGINPRTFYTWVYRLRGKAEFPIPAFEREIGSQKSSNEIVRLNVIAERPCEQEEPKASNLASPPIPSIEIETDWATFRFRGVVNASIYKETLLALRGEQL